MMERSIGNAFIVDSDEGTSTWGDDERLNDKTRRAKNKDTPTTTATNKRITGKKKHRFKHFSYYSNVRKLFKSRIIHHSE